MVQTFLLRRGAQIVLRCRRALNDLSDVAFVAGMMRMNCRSATTCDISNRCPWLSDRKEALLFHVKDMHRSICCHNIEINAKQLKLDANLFFVEVRLLQMAMTNDVPILLMTCHFLQAFISSESNVRRMLCPGWSGRNRMDAGDDGIIEFSVFLTMEALRCYREVLRTAYHHIAWALVFIEIVQVHPRSTRFAGQRCP